MAANVAINGYGTIGKRVADAVSMQKDMKIIGVTKTKPDFHARLAAEKYPLYAAVPESTKLFEDAGIKCEGTIENLLEDAEIIIDCSPGKIGAANKEKYYVPKNKKTIYQGGEKSKTVEASFNPLCNYPAAFEKNHVRVVSCNTTGLSTTLSSIQNAFRIRQARAVMIRRAADPHETDRGPVNAIEPDPVSVPSHHGPDVQTVLPGLKITTMAVVVPTTLAHLHAVMVELEKPTTTEEVIALWEKSPRILLVKANEGLDSTAKVMEYAKELGRPRGDINEICVWRESVTVQNNELYYMQMIHQESNVIPSNIDCVRAMLGLEKDAMTSIRKTDEALGLKKWW